MIIDSSKILVNHGFSRIPGLLELQCILLRVLEGCIVFLERHSCFQAMWWSCWFPTAVLETLQRSQRSEWTQRSSNSMPSALPPLPEAHFDTLKLGEASLSWSQFNSVQSLSRVWLLWPHESRHAKPPCPSPIPGVHPKSCASSRWCHPAISYSVVPFSTSKSYFSVKKRILALSRPNPCVNILNTPSCQL